MDFNGHDDGDEEEGEIGNIPPSGGAGSTYVETPPLPQPHRLNLSSFPSTLATVNKPEAAANVPSTPAASGRYRECLKNHAVGIGGHAVDGCGEFMAAGEEGTLEGLKCAACNCHRNFHRKEALEGVRGGMNVTTKPPSCAFHTHQFSPYYQYHHHMAQPPRLALPSTSGEQDDLSSDPTMVGGGGTTSSGKKRFRTKFTQEQKDKMLELADKLGWRMQKHDETSVQQFCAETGVQRHVLKVWMHNNKLTLGKNPTPTTTTLIQHVPRELHLQDHHQHLPQHQMRSSGERSVN